jgi:hypothetical protein
MAEMSRIRYGRSEVSCLSFSRMAVARSLEPFAERRKCAKTGHSAFRKTTKACSLSRHSAMLKPC